MTIDTAIRELEKLAQAAGVIRAHLEGLPKREVVARDCPACNSPTRVLDTRDTRRLRQCENGHRFYTEEVFLKAAPRAGAKRTAKKWPS